ncbi:MAG: phosphotransferase [Pseudomonadales bacterium]
MATKLPGADVALNLAVADWQRRAQQQFSQVEPLHGSGNQSVKLTSPEQVVVLRLNGKTGHLGVDRRREHEVLLQLTGTDLHAELLYAGNQYWVFEYLESTAAPSTCGVARALNRLHQLESNWISQQPRWTPMDTIHDYLQLTPAARNCFAPHLAKLAQVDWSQSPYALCHIDLNPDNMIVNGETVRFIDWEYARVGPTVYDLAVLLSTCEFIHRQDLLTHYDDKVDPELLNHAQLAYGVIELLWYALTESQSWPSQRLTAQARRLFQQFS